MTLSRDILDTLGEIDIYVFDQLMKGRFDSARRVLDAGCGEGRNLVYLLKQGHECFGIDRAPGAIADIRALAAQIAPHLPADNFVAGEIDAMPWPDGGMDAIICSATLHFARDMDHFDRMMHEMWRVLKQGGVFFARIGSIYAAGTPAPRLAPRLAGAQEPRSGSSQSPLAGTPGPNVAGRRVRTPDGAERFVVDEQMLMDYTHRLGAVLLDPIKTTIVHGQRAMTTWVLRKS